MTKPDLPGFYFDSEKNRYFPIKGPIPGGSKRTSSSCSTSSAEQNKKHQVDKAGNKKKVKSPNLLHSREIHGRFFPSRRCRYNFEQQYEKLQASRPLVCEYPKAGVSCSALEQVHGVLQTAKGLKESYLLLASNVNFSVRLYNVGNIRQQFDSGFRCMPDPVWPVKTQYDSRDKASFGSLWFSSETCFSSDISCIRRIGSHCPDPVGVSSFQRTLVTTVGSGSSDGSLYILNPTKPLDYDASVVRLHTSRIASFPRTIWTADCNRHGTHAVIGTNCGAVLIDLETRVSSWTYPTKSDIFSQQFDHSGNTVLCGFRSGAITAVDVRQKQSRYMEVPKSLRRTFKHGNISTKQNSKIRSTSTSGVCMPSSVCSLVALQSDDQYFLGSSMDGSILLYDHRLLDRGAVQSYEGHVNSHNKLQLGVNPSETLLLSGGEDCGVRIWSLKSSELVFEEVVSKSMIRTVCWRQGIEGIQREPTFFEDNPLELNQSHGAWLGSYGGIHYLHF